MTHVQPARRRRVAALIGAASLLVPAALATTTAEAVAKPRKPLPDTVRVKGVMQHLDELHLIAERKGDRASGQPGYRASRNYVVNRLERAGYKPRVQAFEFAYFEEVSPTVLERTAPTKKSYADGTDHAVMTYSASGDVTAPVTPVDLEMVAGSTSGCEAEDFAGFPAGSIALIRRGTCDFATKASNAQDAGAAAAIIMNQGNEPGRTEVLQGTLGEPGWKIPVIGTSTAVGDELAAPGTEARVVTDTVAENRTTWNVLAQTRGGNPDNVVMSGAHLDSVSGGPGINDNGSGSAALLEVAEQYAKRPAPRNKVRFAWWGAEELGLLGSEHYVAEMLERRPGTFRRIALYLNYDMVASPNYALMVYDGDNSAFPVGPDAAEAPEGSAAIERMFHRFFDAYGTGSDETAFSGRSDYGPFIADNVPSGGLFTGAEGTKTPEQAVQFGGTAGEPYDACYHEPCDGLRNLSKPALEANSKAMAFALTRYARSTRSVNGTDTGHEPPAPQERARMAPRHVSGEDLHEHAHERASR